MRSKMLAICTNVRQASVETGVSNVSNAWWGTHMLIMHMLQTSLGICTHHRYGLMRLDLREFRTVAGLRRLSSASLDL